MKQQGTFRVFVSAVSGELGSYRREVARVLRRKGLEVRDQDHFHQGGATLLEQLQQYIRQCDAVVLLVGDRCGSFPTPQHAAALGPVPAAAAYQAATGQPQASYTQWEFFLAKHHGRSTYTFLTAPGFTPDAPNSEDAGLQECQQAYRRWLTQTGEHYDRLTTLARLIEDVLVLPLPDLARPKPVQLPFPSLGTLFKGRDEFLRTLRDKLQRAAGRAVGVVAVQAIHGLGGVGKTRAVIEYAWQHQDDYSALLFISAPSPEDLQRNLASLCGRWCRRSPRRTSGRKQSAWPRCSTGWSCIRASS